MSSKENYTPSQLRTILSAAPPAESLNGYELKYRQVLKGDSYWSQYGYYGMAGEGGCWVVEKAPVSPFKALIRISPKKCVQVYS